MAAFLGGVLVVTQLWTSDAPPSDPTPVDLATPAVARKIRVSPIEEPAAKPSSFFAAPTVTGRSREKKTAAKLPSALLTALASRAASLKHCSAPAGTPAALPATIRLRKGGRPASVSFLRERELPGEWVSCLRSEILRWRVEDPAVPQDVELLVTLTLDEASAAPPNVRH